MSSPPKCPKCGAECLPPAGLLFVCDDPKMRKHLPIGLPGAVMPGQTEFPAQLIRCSKCGYAEMHDPSFDIPDPLG